ncbi:uncharacterized protein LOC127092099 [Lathyrus oleraceus]|uniref:uncharacterized protein LOC127092099 n=1 Tax=Pisum sativum TaxID=3888 RepID=UPI0021CF4D56|nr:uncharacterized protein LOC127092099 [Pisum sativum]
MGSNQKSTYSFKFRNPKLGLIKGLISDVKKIRRNNFCVEYGDLLTIMNTEVDAWAIFTLAQLYDPPLRCFTFQDFQLAPTLEEFSHIANISIKDEVPYTGLGGFPTHQQIGSSIHLDKAEVKANLGPKGDTLGFTLKFLVGKASDFKSKEDWVAFNVVLALILYGIVLFPNIDDFVDMTVIRIFLLKNPIPTLLADVYHSIHWRNEKKGGMIQCCAPLLYKWFLSHLPSEGPFVQNKDNLKWSQKIMSLTANDITWYSRVYDDVDIIVKCGNFHNVPLIGTRGCINYNPELAMRQLGFPMNDKPKDKLLEGFLLGEGVKDFDLVKRIGRAWTKVRREGKRERGKKNCIARGPYTSWVQARASQDKLPYPYEPPMHTNPPEPTHVTMEEAKELKVVIQTNVERTDKEEYKRKRVKQGLDQADSCLNTVKSQLKEAVRDCREKEKWWKLATKQKKEIRETLEAEIANLSVSLFESKEREERERRSKESVMAATQVTPEMWKGKCQKAENANEWERYWRGRHDSLLQEGEDWMNARENVNASLEACEETIQFLHEQRNEYRDKFASLIDFCNGMATNVPFMLRCALEDIDNDNIPHSVTEFIYLCEDMMKRFKGELEDLNKQKPAV